MIILDLIYYLFIGLLLLFFFGKTGLILMGIATVVVCVIACLVSPESFEAKTESDDDIHMKLKITYDDEADKWSVEDDI